MRTFLLFAILITQLSCVDLAFKEPQPEGVQDISEFPQELIGTFANNQDTIIVSKYMIVSGNDSTRVSFSDTVRLRSYGGWHFLSLTEREQDYWTVVCAKRTGNKLIIKIPEMDKEDRAKLEKRWAVTDVYNELNNLDAYLIDPKKEEWNKLLRSKLFTSTKLRKIE